MSINDLLFLSSALFLLILLTSMIKQAIRGQWSNLQRTARTTAIFLTAYTFILIVISLATPRKFIPPGEARCFDDWCVAAKTAEAAGDNVWIATLEVSSRAKRVRQSAPDAAAMLEDTNGNRYQPGAQPKAKHLTDFLEAGESFLVQIPYLLPAGAQPAGIVISHGAFPGILIIGDTQSFLHQRTLSKVTIHPL